MPLDLNMVNGSKFAIFMLYHEDGKEDDGIVLFGRAKWDGKHFSVVWAGNRLPFPIPDDTLCRIKPNTEDLEDILGDVEYWITLHVGPKPDTTDGEVFLPTGFKWPDDNE